MDIYTANIVDKMKLKPYLYIFMHMENVQQDLKGQSSAGMHACHRA